MRRILDDYITRHPLSPKALAQWRAVASRLPEQPTPHQLDSYIEHARRTYAPATAATHARILGALARHARIPWHPPRITLPQEPPAAWTLDQLRLILDAVRSAPPNSPWTLDPPGYWTALIRTTYATAARLGTLLALRWTDWTRPVLTAPAHTTKTRRYQTWRLDEETADAIDRLPRQDEHIFPRPARLDYLHRGLRRIIRAAGLPEPRGHRQLFHRLRRTAVTALAATGDLQAAARLAGHADPRTTLRHYVDPRLLPPTPAPPPIPTAAPRLRIMAT